MYSDSSNSERNYSAPQVRPKTRTLHLSEKTSQNGNLYYSQEIERIEKEALSRRINYLSDENQRLKSQIETIEQDFQKHLKDKAEDIEALQMEKLDNEVEIRSLKEKYEEIYDELNQKKEENSRLSREVEGLNEKLDNLSRGNEKLKSANNSLTMRLDREQSTSMYMNQELENQSQKVQENYSKKLSDIKNVYKKKLKSMKSEVKTLKSLEKDLEFSEQKRLEILKEFDAFRIKVKEDQSRSLQEHSEHMRKLDEISQNKLNEFEGQLELKLRTENESLANKYLLLQQENEELMEKTLEKERFFLLYKEDSARDSEDLHKAIESLQKANESQRKKLSETHEKLKSEMDRKIKENEVIKQENDHLKKENDEKSRLTRDEMQRLAQRIQEKTMEISNLRGLLTQKTQELEFLASNNQGIKDLKAENARLINEKESLITDNMQKTRYIENLKESIKELENSIKDLENKFDKNEKSASDDKKNFLKEIEEKNSKISGLNKQIESIEHKLTQTKGEFSQLENAKIQGISSLKNLENEKMQLLNRIGELQGVIKGQEKKYQQEIQEINKELEIRNNNEMAQNMRKLKDIEARAQSNELREKELKTLLDEKNSKIRTLQSKNISLKEKSQELMRLLRQNMKDLKEILASLNPGVLFESMGLELQEKLIGLSGTFIRKIALERHRIEGVYIEERSRLKEKQQKETEELLIKLKEKDQKIMRGSEERLKRDQGNIKELEKVNKGLIEQMNEFKGVLKNKEREIEIIKGDLEKILRENKELKGKIDKFDGERSKEKEKACKDLVKLREEIDELYQGNKRIFEEFQNNIKELKDNQEQELQNINENYDEIIEVLKEKVKFYEDNGQLLNQDNNQKCADLEKYNKELQEQLKGVKDYYEEQMTILDNKYNQILFQNTMEADKALRNLGMKAQENERLEQKIKDLDGIIKTKTQQIEELSSKNSGIEGKLKNMQFQLELKNNQLNLNSMQISEELSKYKEELLENPSLMPSNSFKSKHYNKTPSLGMTLPLTLNSDDKSTDIFNKRINELKQLSQSISTNPLNTYKELPGEDEKKDGGFTGIAPVGGNLHRYSKSSSNYQQYANKLVEKTSGFNSHRDQVKTEEKKPNLHRNNQKSSLI